MKRMLLNGSEIDEKNGAEIEAGLMKGMLLKWKRDWWKDCAEVEVGFYIKVILYFATNYPQQNVLRQIVRDKLSYNELSGNHYTG